MIKGKEKDETITATVARKHHRPAGERTTVQDVQKIY